MIRQSIIIYQYFIRRNRQHTMHTGSNTLECFLSGRIRQNRRIPDKPSLENPPDQTERLPATIIIPLFMKPCNLQEVIIFLITLGNIQSIPLR